jgi:hypothetical protein
MITLKVNIENEIYANMFAELISNFTFVQSVEIPQLTIMYHSQFEKTDEILITPPKKIGNPAVYSGIWSNKDINDVKQFRNNLWQRKK